MLKVKCWQVIFMLLNDPLGYFPGRIVHYFPQVLSQLEIQCKATGAERGHMSLQKEGNKKADDEIAEKNESAKRIELCP